MNMYFCRMCIAATTAAFILTTGCNKSREDETANSDVKTVRIQLSTGPSSRAVGLQVEDGTAAAFSSGYIYFVNANADSVITKAVKIVASGATEGQINIGDLTSNEGKLIADVPSTSTHVFVAGNKTLPAVTPGTTSISAIKNTIVPVDTLYDNVNRGVAKVPVYVHGAPGAIVLDGEGPNYKATLNVSPVGARIEIAKIRTDIAGGSKVKNFTVNGIFITNYYSQMYLNTAAITTEYGDLVRPSSNVNDYNLPNDRYTMSLRGIVYDYGSGDVGYPDDATSPSYYVPKDPPTGGDKVDVWGYNLLPVATAGSMPHIVIRLTGVETSVQGDPYLGKTWYLTIRNFWNLGENGEKDGKIGILVRGNVYHIDEVVFKESDLAPLPDQNAIDVNVKVTLIPWAARTIGIDFD